jgi:hypothetical protein
MCSMIQVASRMAVEATTELFGAASSSAAKRGTAMQRHFRDSAIYLGRISARHDIVAAEAARMHAGPAGRSGYRTHEVAAVITGWIVNRGRDRHRPGWTA